MQHSCLGCMSQQFRATEAKIGLPTVSRDLQLRAAWQENFTLRYKLAKRAVENPRVQMVVPTPSTHKSRRSLQMMDPVGRRLARLGSWC